MTPLGVGLIGTGFMGKCHALAWNAVAPVFGDVERPRLAVLGGGDAGACRTAGRAHSASRARPATGATLVADPEVDVVSITTPNPFHPDDGDRGARGRQARLVREADGGVACGRRAHARSGARLRTRRRARLQLHPEPGDPPHAPHPRRGADRRGQSCPRRDGRGFHGRSGGAVLLEERGLVRPRRARRFRRPSAEPDLGPSRRRAPGLRPHGEALCRPARSPAAGGGRSRPTTSPRR